MKPVLVISDRDNVATALQALEAGRRLGSAAPSSRRSTRTVGSQDCLERSGRGSGDRYGSRSVLRRPRFRRRAQPTHNLASTRGRGDPRAPTPSRSELAEPSS